MKAKEILSMTLVLALLLCTLPFTASAAANYTVVEGPMDLTLVSPAEITTDKAKVILSDLQGYVVLDNTYGEHNFAIAYTITVTNLSNEPLQRAFTAEAMFFDNKSSFDPSGSALYPEDVGLVADIAAIKPGETKTWGPLVRGEWLTGDKDPDNMNLTMTLVAYNEDMSKITLEHIPITIGSATDVPVTPNPPVKETPSSWALDSVNSAIAAGLVPEILQAKYTTATTRAEFCALAVALYETVTGSTITERSTFSDTTDVNVEKAAAIGVVSGVGDNKFSPDSKLTREQAATMLARLANAIGKPLEANAPTFADNSSISSWAIDSVGQVQAAGIMSGVGNNTFSPAADYTREQSIITIMRLYDNVK